MSVWWTVFLGSVSATPMGLLCPQDMLLVAGGTGIVGQHRPAYGEDQVPPVAVKLDSYCVGVHPVPGRAGDAWPADGLAADALVDMEGWLGLVGVRLCTVEELVWASAIGESNLPFATGQNPPQACEPSISWGDMKPFGHWEGCVNAWGLWELHVASSWARSSVAVDQARMAHRTGPYVVVGGTNRNDTFYAPNNFGLHLHDPGDPVFFDDQLRVCADPGAVDAAAWVIFQEVMAAQGSFLGTLAWLERHGVDASPTRVLEDHRIFLRDE